MRKSLLPHLLPFTLFCFLFLLACNADNGDLSPDQLITLEKDYPHISGFSPLKGKEGSALTITGKGFGTNLEAVTVNLNGTKSVINNLTDSKIEISVPYWCTTGPISVYKVAGGLETSENVDLTTISHFEVLPSEFEFYFDPLQGYEGDSVVLYLENFVPDAFTYHLELQGLAAEVIEAAPGTMTVTLPMGGLTGPFMLSMNGQTFETDLPFTMAPVITDVSPIVAFPGEVITLSGRNFGLQTDQNTITINGLEADVVQVNADGTQLSFVYPRTFGGQATLTVQGPVGPLMDTSNPINVNLPVIESFPSPVKVEEVITITGMYFASTIAENQVFFQGPYGTTLEATILSASSTELQVQVPLEARTGELVVTTYSVPELTDTSDTDIVLDSWRQLPDLPISGRKNAFCAVLDGDIYIGTGRAYANRLEDFYVYRATTGNWEQLPSFPGGPIEGTFYFTLNNTLYVGGGRNAADQPNNKFWKFNPSQGWTQLNNFGAPDNFRVFATATSDGQYGYVYGGLTMDNNVLGDFWQYDPQTDSWSSLPGFETGGRLYSVSFQIHNGIYVGTGLNENLKKVSNMQRFNIGTNSWTGVTNFPENRHSASGFSVDGKAYILNGKTFNQQVFEYEPASNTWVQKMDFPGEVRRGAIVIVKGDQAFVLMGEGYGYPTDFWEYTPGNEP